MHELNGDNEDMTGLNRVRRQIDRALNRRDPLDAKREKQIEFRNIFEQIAFELRYSLRDIPSEESQEVNAPNFDEMVELTGFNHNFEGISPENNEEVSAPILAEMVELMGLDHNLRNNSSEHNEEADDLIIIDDLSIVDRLIEIEYLLKQQERELKNRAINKYIVLGCIWAVGAITLFAVHHNNNCSYNMRNFEDTPPSLDPNN